MQRTYLFLFILACATVTGCAGPAISISGGSGESSSAQLTPKDLFIPASIKLVDVEQLNRSDAQADIQLLTYALRRGYAGSKYIDHELFTSALARLAEIPDQIHYPVSSRDLLEAIDRVLIALPDNHLQAQSAIVGQSQARRASERAASVGANVALGSAVPWSLSRRGKIPILSVTSLPSAQDPAWTGFKPAVEKWLAGPTAILDLRGNGGGSDEMMAWLAVRVAGMPIRSPDESRFTSRTPETMALLANNTRFEIMIEKIRHQATPAYLTDRLNEQMRNFEQARVSSADGFEETRFDALGDATGFTPYQGHLFILVDAACVSACEGAVKFFSGLANARTVGENTGGYFHFGNIGMLILPHSRLLVTMGSSYFTLRDHTFVEKVGIAPDVRVAPGTDALKYTLDNLAN